MNEPQWEMASKTLIDHGRVDRLIALYCLPPKEPTRWEQHAAKMRARPEAQTIARKRAIMRAWWAQRREKAA